MSHACGIIIIDSLINITSVLLRKLRLLIKETGKGSLPRDIAPNLGLHILAPYKKIFEKFFSRKQQSDSKVFKSGMHVICAKSGKLYS